MKRENKDAAEAAVVRVLAGLQFQVFGLRCAHCKAAVIPERKRTCPKCREVCEGLADFVAASRSC